MAAEQKHDATKQETADWGCLNGPTPANVMCLAQAHLDEEIGVLSDEE
jgi:hypothetical protein